MSEYSKVMDDYYEAADNEGLLQPDTAWLYINDAVWWPNPHYKGEPVVHPEDPTGTQTNPPLPTENLRERYLKRQEGKK